MLKAEYQQRGPVPQDVISAVPLQLPEPAAGQVRVKVRVTGGSWSKELELNNREGVPVADGE